MVNAIESRKRNHDERAKGRINEGKFNIPGQHGFAVDGAVLEEGFDALAVDHHIDREVCNAGVFNDLPSAKKESQ